MKIKPVISERLQTTHTNYSVDLRMDANITFISGDSGVGKSAVFSFLQELATEDKRIRCINYLDLKTGYKNAIKRSKGKLFVIDNADLLLDDDMRRYIAMDTVNQYIIIGRNPTGLMLTTDDVRELEHQENAGKVKLSLRKAFD